MLQHFHAGDRVERAGLGRGERLDRLQAIVHGQPGFEQVQLRHFDQLGREIECDHVRALARQRLAEQPGAAADVEHARAGEADAVAHVTEPRRIEFVQRALRALRVPPAPCERPEFLQLGGAGIDTGAIAAVRGFRCRVHDAGAPIAAMRSRHCRAFAPIASVSISVSRPSASLRTPAIQTSLTWWRPVAYTSCETA